MLSFSICRKAQNAFWPLNVNFLEVDHFVLLLLIVLSLLRSYQVSNKKKKEEKGKLFLSFKMKEWE